MYPAKGYLKETHKVFQQGVHQDSRVFQEENELVCVDRHGDGVLVWSHSAIKLSEKLKSKHTDGCRRDIVAYLFEGIYSLIISPTHNVSKSLGSKRLGLFDC